LKVNLYHKKNIKDIFSINPKTVYLVWWF